jgi:hypothetical protein
MDVFSDVTMGDGLTMESILPSRLAVLAYGPYPLSLQMMTMKVELLIEE